MSNQAIELLKLINTIYQNRLANGEPKGKANVFANQLFTQNYHYDTNTLNNLLNELSDYGYIKKWIISAFVLQVD